MPLRFVSQIAIVLIAGIVAGIGLAPSAAVAAESAEGGTSGSHESRDDHPVIISEIAAGWMDRSDAGFVELQNVSAEPVDLTGWHLYRCNEEGLRAKRGVSDADFSGVTLQPGERYLLARAGESPGGAVADESLYVGLSALGVGYVLEDPNELIADRVAVYPTTPWMMTSECDPSGSISNTLDVLAGESWQRFGATATDDGHWAIAMATPSRENVNDTAVESLMTGVVIAEVAPFGRGGSGDDLVELRNDGERTQSLDGWTLWRCTATGVRSTDTRQFVFDPRDALEPGQRIVIGGPQSSLNDVRAIMSTSFADLTFGVQVRDATGALVDEVAVSHQRDSACQSGPEKLPALLDAARDESYQRVEGGREWLIAPRTPGQANATAADSLARQEPLDLGIVVTEIATDPLDVAAISEPNNFIELTNTLNQSIDLSGWSVWSCEQRGTRSLSPLVTFDRSTSLGAGQSMVIAARQTAAAATASALYDTPLHFLGTGALVMTDDGRIADRVGVFHVNEMDESIEPPSLCTNAVSLVTFQPDRLVGETFHRSSRTGVDLVDFRTDLASPGRTTATEPVRASASSDVSSWLSSYPVPLSDVGLDPFELASTDDERSGGSSIGQAAAPDRVVVGTTSDTLLSGWSLNDEAQVPDSSPMSQAAGWEYPAMRLEYSEPLAGTVSWSGVVSARHRVVLSVWSEAGQWSMIGESTASTDGEVAVAGAIPAVTVSPTPSGAATALLVQVVPSPRSAEQRATDGALEGLDMIDSTIVHMTDTQYLSEGYPAEYDRMTQWVTELAGDRDVSAVVHTGDLVQSWVDPDQDDTRARVEFERASAAQQILEDAGLVSTVLPGNHDTKRGLETDLYNEYFGPDRYRDAPGFVAPIAPNDATSSYTIVDAGAAPMLILSIGYGYGERELAWAERIVTTHPRHNVIIATHEHLTPLTLEDPSRRATSNRWLSRADEMWRRVVEPNRNVIAVLAGHYHGLGAIVTLDAGDIEGHHVVELLADYQEFRTHTGERATGFLRLLQLDLAAGVLAVDTYSPRLDESVSAPYDAVQFRLENGEATNAANGRPWNIIAIEREDRYGIDDDEFMVDLTFQYDKSMMMSKVSIVTSSPDDHLSSASRRIDAVVGSEAV